MAFTGPQLAFLQTLVTDRVKAGDILKEALLRFGVPGGQLDSLAVYLEGYFGSSATEVAKDFFEKAPR